MYHKISTVGKFNRLHRRPHSRSHWISTAQATEQQTDPYESQNLSLWPRNSITVKSLQVAKKAETHTHADGIVKPFHLWKKSHWASNLVSKPYTRDIKQTHSFSQFHWLSTKLSPRNQEETRIAPQEWKAFDFDVGDGKTSPQTCRATTFLKQNPFLHSQTVIALLRSPCRSVSPKQLVVQSQCHLAGKRYGCLYCFIYQPHDCPPISISISLFNLDPRPLWNSVSQQNNKKKKSQFGKTPSCWQRNVLELMGNQQLHVVSRWDDSPFFVCASEDGGQSEGDGILVDDPPRFSSAIILAPSSTFTSSTKEKPCLAMFSRWALAAAFLTQEGSPGHTTTAKESLLGGENAAEVVVEHLCQVLVHAPIILQHLEHVWLWHFAEDNDRAYVPEV